MGQKKLPLVIHVEDWGPVSINKTCRFCSRCDLLIVHKDEIENLMAQLFQQREPKVVGNDYLVIGTLDRTDWKQACQDQIMLQDMIEVARLRGRGAVQSRRRLGTQGTMSTPNSDFPDNKIDAKLHAVAEAMVVPPPWYEAWDKVDGRFTRRNAWPCTRNLPLPQLAG